MSRSPLTLALGLLASLAVTTSCSSPSAPSDDDDSAQDSPEADSAAETATASEDSPDDGSSAFTIEDRGSYDSPWALEFLPGTEQMLITTQTGELYLREMDGSGDIAVEGVPEDIVVEGQGGLGDVVAAPDFEESQRVYLSWVTSDEDGTGAVVGHAELNESDSGAELEDLTVIWEQTPFTSGSGHFSHRMAFSPDGEHLFVTSGDRQEMDPAQDLGSSLGKIMRLTPEGEPAQGNPFADEGGVAEEIWTYGHRNALGIEFAPDGQLWVSEMGPEGGDELNAIEEGDNYGWPEASNGSHYGGGEIPDHTEADDFTAPVAWWTPSISPGSLMIYDGELFEDWQGDAFLGALSGEALVRVGLDGQSVEDEEIWDMEERIRDVAEAPDGSIWLIEDGDDAALLQVTPAE